MDSRERRPVTEVVERAWGELERTVEEGVKRALFRLKAPRREQLLDFSARLDGVEKRLEALLRRR